GGALGVGGQVFDGALHPAQSQRCVGTRGCGEILHRGPEGETHAAAGEDADQGRIGGGRGWVVVAYEHEVKDAKDPSKSYTTTWFDMWRFKDGKADEHWDPATRMQ